MAEPLRWRHRTGTIVLDRTKVMGVLNVTPDSFSDGGRYADPQVAVLRAFEMFEEGADVIDVGGESTRPGANPVSPEEEWRRIGPVLDALGGKVHIPISVDTRRPEVAEKALHAGASIVNDVSGLRDPKMIRVVARERAGVVVMHMLGEPRTMQQSPRYRDVVQEVRDYLDRQIRAARYAGVPSDSIAVDPGIGFGKTLDQNLGLLRGIDALAGLGYPVVIGVSRKSFLGPLGAGDSPEERLAGSLAAATLASVRGAHVIRAHDVLETVQAMRVASALTGR
jgi:dihydropteroate synthase